MKLFISGAMALFVLPISFLADTTTTTDAVPALATLFVQLGLSGVFLWQWQSERKERSQAQGQLLDFLEKFGPTLADAIKVLHEVQQGLVSTVDRVKVVPDRNDYDLALRRLEHLTDEMGELVHERRRTRDT